MVAGVLVLGLGGTVGFLALTDDDEKPASSGGASQSSVDLPSSEGKKDAKGRKSFPPAIDPRTVTVAVVNGTTVTGLAARTGTKVTAAGFSLGNIATGSQQARAESVVMFKQGANRQARAVARKLSINQIAPIDTATLGLAGTATVVVVVGADKAGQ
jgi:hypothetical protein